MTAWLLAKIGAGDARAGRWLAAVLAVTALAYCRCLGNEFVFDDDPVIAANPYLGRWSFFFRSLVNDAWWYLNPSHLPQSAYYRPFLDIWRGINIDLFGRHPLGWHAAMILLHLVVVWLVFQTASLLTGDCMTAVLAAALFGLMPIHVEAVAWAAAVSYPLCAAFALGAFEAYLPAGRVPITAEPPDSGAPRELAFGAIRSRRLALSLGLFGGALLTQEGAVAFPMLIAAHAFLIGPNKINGPQRRFVDAARDAIAAAWPYVLLTVIYLGVRLWVLGFITQVYPLHPLNTRETILTIPAALVGNLMLLALPWRTGPAHRLEFAHRIAQAQFYLPLAALAAICIAGYLLLRRHPHRRLYWFCALWIPIALAPMLTSGGLFAPSLVQDRYLYLPSFGWCVAVADATVVFARGGRRRAIAAGIGAAAVIAAFAALLFAQVGVWHDEVSLFSRCVAQVPGIEYCHNRLGVALAARDDYPAAREQFERAIKLEPDDTLTRYNLALVDERLGDRQGAERALVERLARLPHPAAKDYAELAFSAAAASDDKTAEADLNRARAMPGGTEIALLTSARIKLFHKDYPGAEKNLRKLLARDPNDELALEALAEALIAEKRYQESLAPLKRAAALAPGQPAFHYKIALVLHRLGREDEARRECAVALEMSPDNPSARALMAAIRRNRVE
ncbi:MAG: tetratricopeptide repeat protein [Candidatus Binataceae bacterium]